MKTASPPTKTARPPKKPRLRPYEKCWYNFKVVLNFKSSQRNWFKWKWFLKKIHEDLHVSCNDDSIYFWMLNSWNISQQKSKSSICTPYIPRCLETSEGNILNQYYKYICVIYSNTNNVFDLWVTPLYAS